MQDSPRGERARYRVERVTLEDEDEQWTREARGEWRVIDERSGEVVLRFAWKLSEDRIEHPERRFYTGPYSVTVDEAAGEVELNFTMEHQHGVTFEGAPRPASTQRVKLPISS
jgi:hypothetical protein